MDRCQSHKSTWSGLTPEAQGLLPETSTPSCLLHVESDFWTGADSAPFHTFLMGWSCWSSYPHLKWRPLRLREGMAPRRSSRSRIQTHSCGKAPESDLFPPVSGCHFSFLLDTGACADGTKDGWAQRSLGKLSVGGPNSA